MLRDKKGWRVQWTSAGRRKSRNFDDRKSAQMFELELKLGITSQVEGKAQTFDEFAARWIRDVCKTEKAESQWRKDERTIKLHLSPAFGSVNIKALRKGHLIQLKSDLGRKKQHGKKGDLSPKSVNLILALAKRIMASAVDLEAAPLNPFAGVKLLKLADRDFAYWQPAERDRFLEATGSKDPEFAALVAMACHTGLRLGELAALRRSDLDFDRRRIRVGGSYALDLEKRFPTKGKEVADVPMNSEVLKYLAPKRFLQAEASVFPRAVFGWVGFARHRLAVLAKEAGVRPIRFHDLRHTFASNLAMAGVDLMLIQRLMRHKSYQMTLRYAHLHPDHLEGATDVLCTRGARKITAKAKSGGPRGT